jgi:polyisoprenyl-teichoic acid--peptidoglycan teichoic acid transferase
VTHVTGDTKPVPATTSTLGRLTAADAAQAARRVQLRRALTLLAMTLVAPGSAQLVAGNKTVGRIALRVYAALVSVVAGLVLVAIFRSSELVTLGTSLWWLRVLRFGLIAVALGWGYLIVDAWRIAEPIALARGHRLAMTAVNGVVCLSLTGGLLFASHLVAVQRDLIATIFSSDEVSAATDGRYNVLLLGGDSGKGRVGLRPDSITVVSIDADTGRAVLIGLPRNLANAPFPKGTVMHRQFPAGFNCDGCYLNAVNTWATDHASLFGSTKNPGILATSQAVEAITGLPINYYVVIDMHGFAALVDAVGGVTINVHERIPIGRTGGPYIGYIEPGRQTLDGFDTLWFARSRATSDDYARMARQKCVMQAMLRQLDPKTVLLHFDDIAKAGKDVVSTSVPASELDTFIELALKAKSQPVGTLSLVPPRVNTSDPDFASIRSMVSRAIKASESGRTDRPDGAKHHRHRHAGANNTADLQAAC